MDTPALKPTHPPALPPLPAPAPSPPGDGRRAAAVWVAGTGAFLLVAAAAVFVAARWGQLPEAAKLGIVGALTGAFLVGGRALSRSLPATGDVVFHLGALLLPVNLAALDVRAGLGWRGILVTEGLLGVVGFGVLAATSGSVVLRWAAVASVPALAAGVAAVSHAPAPLLVVAAALGVLIAGRTWRPAGVLLATVAGLAPVLGAAAASLLETGAAGAEVLVDLGLAGPGAGLAGLVSGALSAALLGREAKTAGDLRLAALAILSGFSGGGAAWMAADLAARPSLLALPAVLLGIEVVALLGTEDPFWRRPLAGLAASAEWLAALPTLGISLSVLLMAPLLENGFMGDGPLWRPDAAASASLAILAGAWVLSGARRPGQASLRTALTDRAALAVPAAVAAVALGSASAIAISAALLAAAALVGPTGRRQGALMAGAAALWAPAVVWDQWWAMVVAGLVAAVVLAETSLSTVRAGRTGWWPIGLTLAACGAAGAAAGGVRPSGAAWAMAVVVMGLLALRLDLVAGPGSPDRPMTRLTIGGPALSLDLGGLARALAVMTAVVAAVTDTGAALLPVAAATVLAAVEAVWRGRLSFALAAAGGLQFVVADLAAVNGLNLAEAGVVLCLGAVVWAGLALVSGDRWRQLLLAAAGTGLAAGLVLAGGDERLLADGLLITAALLAAAGLTTAQPWLGYAAGATAATAAALHLSSAGVLMSEPYVAPVAVLLLVAGEHARRRPDCSVSSWLAHVPAIALLGGAAMAERLGGGGAGHALLAGAVGVAAVAAGGVWRLAGPLVAGTALLVAVTGHESLARLATVPTWAWLGAAGAGLLGLGIALERHGATPAEAGRRLVDVIGDRFR